MGSPGLRDAVYAGCLALVLAVGVVGVLLLNTSMQQQSHRIDRQHQQIGDLATRIQQLRTGLDRAGDPALLAEQARRLHMRPVARVRFAIAAPSAHGHR